MEIRLLRYFLTVVREQSITKAAETLHITQPTLSRQLTQLEEETGVTLFQRGGGNRKFTLTNEGMLLRRRAEEIVELMDITEQELLTQDEMVEGTVSLGSGEYAATQLLAELCGNFYKKYPKVKFEMYTGTADTIKERIERGLTDVGILLEPVDMERFEFIRLREKERWAVCMRADDPLAKKDAITTEDLLGLPLILPSRLNVQSELANWFGDDFAKLNVTFTGNLATNSAIMVQNGLGYGVMLESSFSFWNPDLIITRPLSPLLSATNVLAWKRGQPFVRATEKFIEETKCLLGMKSL